MQNSPIHRNPTTTHRYGQKALAAALFCIVGICLGGMQSPIFNQRSAITYRVSGGRLGDNLLAVSHAAWISYLHDHLEIIYKSFPLCEKFAFSQLCDSDKSLNRRTFSSWVQFTYLDRITRTSELEQSGVLYIVPYFPDFAPEWKNWPFAGPGNGPCCTIDWNDDEFMKRLSQLLAPIEHYNLPQLPSGMRSIALHVRRGGGVDPDNINQAFPHKFPAIDFYIYALKYLYKEFDSQPLYVFVFTDDLNPRQIVDDLRKALKGLNIVFDFRASGNNPHSNVIEDFLFMQKFPIVVRPHSNYSYIAAKLGRASIEIEPERIFWNGNKMIIESIAILNSGSKKVIIPAHSS